MGDMTDDELAADARVEASYLTDRQATEAALGDTERLADALMSVAATMPIIDITHRTEREWLVTAIARRMGWPPTTAMTDQAAEAAEAAPRTKAGKLLLEAILWSEAVLPNALADPVDAILAIERAAAALVPDSLDAAWADLVDALAPNERAVLFADKGRAQYLQVLRPVGEYVPDGQPEPEDEDAMRPAYTRLVAYPSKGLGNLAAEMHALAAALREGRKP
jgi:hypothetical protein